jgi:hypothetical protein
MDTSGISKMYRSAWVSMFVEDAEMSNNGIVEGDPVIFAGLFVQFTGVRRFEPIVREGRIAMIPGEKVIGTLKSPPLFI